MRFPRQAGDVPQPCRTGCNWFPKCNVSHETLQKLLLGKTIFSVRQKGVPPLLLPASMLQLPRCLVRICNLFLTNHKIADLTVSKNAIAACWQAKAGVEPPFAGCGRSVSLEASFPSNKPQATESFSVQQFFKNAAEVWASSPHLRSKSSFQMKCNKNLGGNRKNRNCL